MLKKYIPIKVDSTEIKNFISHNPNIEKLLKNENEEERNSFFKFATVLGCFNLEKFVDKNGQEIETIYSQKASSLLATFLQLNKIKIGEFHKLFNDINIKEKASQDFLIFLNPTRKKQTN